MGSIRRLIETAVRAQPTLEAKTHSFENQHIVILDDGSDLVLALIRELRQQHAKVILLQPTPQTRPAPTIELNIQEPNGFESIVHRLEQISGDIGGVLWLYTRPLSWDPHWLQQARQQVLAAIAFAKGISTLTSSLPFFYFVTAQGGRFGQDPSGQVDALALGLEALVHPLRMEMPKTSWRSIDLDPQTPVDQQAQQIFTELSQADQDFRTAYGWQQGERAALSVKEIPTHAITPTLNRQSVVVFAGGARGIGAVCAKALAQHTPCTLIFLGRTALSEEIKALSRLSPADRKVKEEAFLKAYKAEHPGCSPREPREAWQQRTRGVEAAETLNALQSFGAQVDYFPIDVREPSSVQQALQQIHSHYGRPDILVHVAGLGGVETDRMLSRKEWSVIERVLETKVTGAINLLQAAEKLEIPLFIGFGSIASRFGNSGQVDYACANALLSGITRAHNAKGKHPVARVIGWGAWDEVGIAVSGPTKKMLQSYGVEFIEPDVGGQAFLGELAPQLDPSHPAELYLSPNWSGLDDLLQREAKEASESNGSVAPQPAYALMGQIVEHQAKDHLRAEHELVPTAIPFLDHHRYDGTSWVPAVMGMEVSVEAAAALHPELSAFALREIRLKKAIRLVRDEPALLITEVKTQSQSPQETVVAATVSGSYKGRTWVFAEMKVILSPDPQAVHPRLQEGIHFHGTRPIQQEPGETLHQTRADLYPSDWLRFQTAGSTFQVIDSLVLNCEVGRTEGQMTQTADLSGCVTPLTLIDGVFQAYGVTLCTLLKTWAGPPLFIGEICWSPEAYRVNTATYKIRTNLSDKQTYPILHMFDPQGQCILRMQQADQGGTSVKELSSRLQAHSQPQIPTPYLGEITELETGRHLKAQRLLDPVEDVLLRDHQFNIFIVVPAVYFMEVAVEAAALLLPDPAPCELRDFHIHQALHLLKDRQTLLIEAERIGETLTRVRLSSEQKGSLKLHAEGYVVHGTIATLGSRQVPGLEGAEVREKAELYPHRFPNGPIFQVIERMARWSDYVSRSDLQLTTPPAPGCWLPITLLDGAFQVDSATRSGFDRTSGLPRRVAQMQWLPEVCQLRSAICLSETGTDKTDDPGEICFVDIDHKVLLHLSGIILTPPLPNLRSRRSE